MSNHEINKKGKTKSSPLSKIDDIQRIIDKKINLFKHVIRKTIQHINNIKVLDIINTGQVCSGISFLDKLYMNLEKFIDERKSLSTDNQLSYLQEINSNLSMVLKQYGTDSLDDFLKICFDSMFVKENIQKKEQKNKLELLKEYFHPTSYKAIKWNQSEIVNMGNKIISNQSNESDESNESNESNDPNDVVGKKGLNSITEDFDLIKNNDNLACFNFYSFDNSFQENVLSIKILLHDNDQQVSLIIIGIVDEISLNCIANKFIQDKLFLMNENIIKVDSDKKNMYKNYITSLTIKDLLIYNIDKLYDRFLNYNNSITYLLNNSLHEIIKIYIDNTLLEKRRIIIQLLLKDNDPELEYLAYLLYDLLTSDINNNVDTQEQIILYDSLPFSIKKSFRSALKNTLQYTEDLYNFSNNIPLEQQICLMKVNNIVKEKAMLKLKEIKAKSEDSGSKARSYLEGLLKIPFNKYRKEEIMDHVPQIISLFNNLLESIDKSTESQSVKTFSTIPIKLQNIQQNILPNLYDETFNKCYDYFVSNKRHNLIKYVKLLNKFLKENQQKYPHICFSGKNIKDIQKQIKDVLKFIFKNDELIHELLKSFNLTTINKYESVNKQISLINTKINDINDYIQNVDDTLDHAVYGHKQAKQQIKRIIGQWIVGENNGYCFGFEGPPGVGKTSLAQKGISQCLKNFSGESRPFSFIAIGGSSNGSTLEGHSYTYVGSTWGKIIDILMDAKCMNPIIFIDELDKISNTENGKEIIGILTHLIDSSQNANFQDKYFSGIDIDLSKALFIFSYNDASLIDRILLDRIHRVKFDRLTILDKIYITKKYIIPEITKKLGLDGDIVMNDYSIKYLINTYTNESGVRKLKEIMFEIVSEINLEILNKAHKFLSFPIDITTDQIDYYLEERHKAKPQKIHAIPTVAIVNGLWANSLGCGGILSIEASFIPSTNFLDLKLTGMQGDVMKESMNVAKTVAWNLLTKKQKETVTKKMEDNNTKGIHIHCPDGATPKDGPSAGTAITILIYSLLTNKKVKNNFAITGEMNLQKKVTEIGGLNIKIIGGIEAGVNEFIFPKSNVPDYEKTVKKYENSTILNNIDFHSVETIEEVIKLIIV